MSEKKRITQNQWDEGAGAADRLGIFGLEL